MDGIHSRRVYSLEQYHKALYGKLGDVQCGKDVAEAMCKLSFHACSKDRTKAVSLLSRQDCRKTIEW